MSNPRKLQEVEAVLLNIRESTETIFADLDKEVSRLKNVSQWLDVKIKNGLKLNQDMAKRNELGVLRGEPNAKTTPQQLKAIEKLDLEATAKNDQLTKDLKTVRLLQANSQASPTDVAQAKALEQRLNAVREHNQAVLKLQKEEIKSKFVNRSLSSISDVESAKQIVEALQEKIKPVLMQNNELKSRFQADWLSTHKMKTGEEPKPQEPTVLPTRLKPGK